MSSVKSFIPLSVIHLCIYSQPDVNIARLNLFQSIGIPHQTQPDQDPKTPFFFAAYTCKGADFRHVVGQYGCEFMSTSTWCCRLPCARIVTNRCQAVCRLQATVVLIFNLPEQECFAIFASVNWSLYLRTSRPLPSAHLWFRLWHDFLVMFEQLLAYLVQVDGRWTGILVDQRSAKGSCHHTPRFGGVTSCSRMFLSLTVSSRQRLCDSTYHKAAVGWTTQPPLMIFQILWDQRDEFATN